MPLCQQLHWDLSTHFPLSNHFPSGQVQPSTQSDAHLEFSLLILEQSLGQADEHSLNIIEGGHSTAKVKKTCQFTIRYYSVQCLSQE